MDLDFEFEHGQIFPLEDAFRDSDLTALLTKEDDNFRAHRTNCILACEKLASGVKQLLETHPRFEFKRHILTFSSGKSSKSQNLPDVHLVIYLKDKSGEKKTTKPNTAEVEKLMDEMIQVLDGAISSVQNVTNCTISASYTGTMNAEIDGLLILIQPAMYLDAKECGGDEVTSLWMNTLDYSVGAEEPILEFVARSGALKLAEYLRWQPMFVRQVVMLLKLWAVSNLAGSDTGETGETGDALMNVLVELIAIKCGVGELRLARELNVKPELSKALAQCWLDLRDDYEEVQFWFDDVQFPVTSAVEKLERMKHYCYSMLLDPINPYMNYLAIPKAAETWTLLLQMAERTSEYLQNRIRNGESGDIGVVFAGEPAKQEVKAAGKRAKPEVAKTVEVEYEPEAENEEKAEPEEVTESVGFEREPEVENDEKAEPMGVAETVAGNAKPEKKGQVWRRIVESDPLFHYCWKLIKYLVYFVGGYVLFLILAFYGVVFYIKYFVAL